MKHGLKISTLAAAVALACGAVSAQEGIDQEGVGIEPRIEASDEAGLDRQQDVGALEGNEVEEQVGEEREHDAIGSDEDELAAIDEGEAAAESESEYAADSEGGDPAKLDSLTEEHEDLGKFVEAVKAAGLAESLTGDTEYTVFAPTDEALESMPEDWLEPANRDQLVSMLRAHIVADNVDGEMAKTLGAAQTIDGGTVEMSAEEDEWKVGDAKVVEPDIQAGNLRIHAIDKVLSENVEVAALDEEQELETDEPAQEFEAEQPSLDEPGATPDVGEPSLEDPGVEDPGSGSGEIAPDEADSTLR